MNWAAIIAAVTAFGGGVGLAALVNAFWSTRKEIRREPLDHRTIQVAHQVDLVGAANSLVASQSSVITELRDEINVLRGHLTHLEDRFQKVLDELESEKTLSRDRGHELERYRMQLAQRDERISDLEDLVSDYGERIDLLEDVLRAADIDPDDIDGNPI